MALALTVGTRVRDGAPSVARAVGGRGTPVAGAACDVGVVPGQALAAVWAGGVVSAVLGGGEGGRYSGFISHGRCCEQSTHPHHTLLII